MYLIAQFDGFATILMLLGLAIIAAVLLRRTSRRLGKRKKNDPFLEKAPRFEPQHGGGAKLPPPEMARWEGEMCDIARDTSARLDSKMHALAELIRRADAAAARLEADLKKAEGGAMNETLD